MSSSARPCLQHVVVKEPLFGGSTWNLPGDHLAACLAKRRKIWIVRAHDRLVLLLGLVQEAEEIVLGHGRDVE